MAYTDTNTGNGYFSRFFSSAKRRARREKMAGYKKKRREVDLMSDKVLAKLGHSRCDMQEVLYRHYFQG